MFWSEGWLYYYAYPWQMAQSWGLFIFCNAFIYYGFAGLNDCPLFIKFWNRYCETCTEKFNICGKFVKMFVAKFGPICPFCCPWDPIKLGLLMLIWWICGIGICCWLAPWLLLLANDIAIELIELIIFCPLLLLFWLFPSIKLACCESELINELNGLLLFVTGTVGGEGGTGWYAWKVWGLTEDVIY